MIRSNPPWSDKILTKHWAALEARVGATWMPIPHFDSPVLAKRMQFFQHVLASESHTPGAKEEAAKAIEKLKKTMEQSKVRGRAYGYREYGCGHYGCVMPTQTPGVVIKVTTDRTEASFVAAYLSLPKSQRPVGIVPYHRIIAIRSESRLKRPVFVLWRDEAQHLGIDGIWAWIKAQPHDADYCGRSFSTSARLLSDCLDAARAVRQRIHGKPDAAQVLTEAMTLRDDAFDYERRPRRASRALTIAWFLNRFQQRADDMQSEPMGAYIGRALSDSLNAGLLLADVHLNNIGMPAGPLAEEIGMTPIVTDPGHAIALDDRYAGVQVEEL